MKGALMALLDVITYPDQVLREKAASIENIDEAIRKLASDMAQTMYAAPGIGLAAPQVGQSVQLITLDIQQGEKGHLHTLINPEIVDSEGEIVYEEGCLSVPDIREEVTRANKVTVKALNLEGKPFSIEGEGLMAVVLQHEIDHLDGFLFIDKLSKLKQALIKKRLKKAKAEQG